MTPTKQKKIALLTRQPPYGSHRPRLCLDIAMAAAAFEQEITYVFLDDGVYQLLADQDATPIAQKTFGPQLETLELYGIESVWADAESLALRDLGPEDLALPVRVVSHDEIAALFAHSDAVINL